MKGRGSRLKQSLGILDLIQHEEIQIQPAAVLSLILPGLHICVNHDVSTFVPDEKGRSFDPLAWTLDCLIRSGASKSRDDVSQQRDGARFSISFGVVSSTLGDGV